MKFRKNTPNKMHNMFLGALRKMYQYSPDLAEAKRNARISPTIYICAGCWQACCDRYSGYTESEAELFHKEDMPLINSEIQVDHVEPVMPLDGFKDWNTHMERLDCGAKGLQILCKSCHYLKS